MNSAKLSGQWGAFTIMGFNCFHISSVHPMATTKVPRTILTVFWMEQCSKYFGHSNVQSMTEQFSIYFWQSVKVFIVGLFNSFHLSQSVKFCETPFSIPNCHSIISNRGGLITIPSDSVATKHKYASLIWIYLWWFGLWLIYLDLRLTVQIFKTFLTIKSSKASFCVPLGPDHLSGRIRGRCADS